MPSPTVAGFFQRLDDELMGMNFIDRRHAWDLLVALRGPDDSDEDLKWEITARIRAHTLPRTAQDVSMAVHPDEPGTFLLLEDLDCIYASRYPTASRHFLHHVALAARALNYDGPFRDDL